VSTHEASNEMATRQANSALPLYNGVISPDKWTTFGRMAHAFAETDFVPKELRGQAGSGHGVPVYGDSLGLHPSVALTEVYVADGKVGISGALMLALIRNADHKIKFEWITSETTRASSGRLRRLALAASRRGRRGRGRGRVDVHDGGRQAGGPLSDTSKPEGGVDENAEGDVPLARARAARALPVPDVFVGQAIYLPDEAEEAAYSERSRRCATAHPRRPAGAAWRRRDRVRRRSAARRVAGRAVCGRERDRAGRRGCRRRSSSRSRARRRRSARRSRTRSHAGSRSAAASCREARRGRDRGRRVRGRSSRRGPPRRRPRRRT
jgi:hypothetical protein